MRSKKPNRSSNLYNVACSVSNFSASIDEKIENLQKMLFDFEYKIPKDFKDDFEKMFIKKYFIYNFSCDTFEFFKILLEQKTQEVFLNYQKILDYYFSTNSFEKNFSDTTTKKYSEKNTGNSRNVSAVLPIGIVDTSKIGDVDFADNGNLTENSNSRENTENSTNFSNVFDKKMQFAKEYVEVFDKILDEFQGLFSILM